MTPLPVETWQLLGGSDVAGGPELNRWQVMRSAVEIQKVRRFADHGVAECTPAEAFHLATLGGAEVLGKEATIGTLDVLLFRACKSFRKAYAERYGSSEGPLFS